MLLSPAKFNPPLMFDGELQRLLSDADRNLARSDRPPDVSAVMDCFCAFEHFIHDHRHDVPREIQED